MNTILLNKTHKREQFDCGKKPLDQFIKQQASQDVSKNASVCYVLEDADSNVIAYYTLSNYSISSEEIPEQLRNKLPKYPTLPVTLIGRLAVDKKYQKKGIGESMLGEATFRALEVSEKVGSIAVVVDPIDVDAEKYYQGYGFKMLDSGMMFLSMKTIRAARDKGSESTDSQ